MVDGEAIASSRANSLAQLSSCHIKYQHLPRPGGLPHRPGPLFSRFRIFGPNSTLFNWRIWFSEPTPPPPTYFDATSSNGTSFVGKLPHIGHANYSWWIIVFQICTYQTPMQICTRPT